MKKIETEVLVIGGGSTGTGVARDLAMRGFNTVLVERYGISQGTTRRYHGLLHSGGRYVVSMLGKNTNWVRNVAAAEGHALLRHGDTEAIHLTEVAPGRCSRGDVSSSQPGTPR